MFTRDQLMRALDEQLPSEYRSAIREAVSAYDRLYAAPHLPALGQSCAVSAFTDKTTALFYDRVWTALDDVPRDIAFHGASNLEDATLLLGAILSYFQQTVVVDQLAITAIRDAFASLTAAAGRQEGEHFAKPLIRAIAEEFKNQHGIHATPVYDSMISRDNAYQAGSLDVIVATISGLPVPIEDRLEWHQVVEFRRDEQMRTKARRLRHWLDAEMVGKSVSYIQDEILNRLDDYEAALRKHGIETMLGSVSAALDRDALAAGSAVAAGIAYTTEPLWGLIAGAGTLVGKVALHIARCLLDAQKIRDSTHPEVSFVAELKAKTNER